MNACPPGHITKQGYREIYISRHPLYPQHKLVLEHRFVMEVFLGRRLTRQEFVHHKDGNRLNNSLSNLELMSPLEHQRHHAPWELTRPARVPCVCQRCGATKELPPCLAKRNKYCSRACRTAALADLLRAERPQTPCVVCGVLVQQTKNVHNARKYCSPACRRIGRGAAVSQARLRKVG